MYKLYIYIYIYIYNYYYISVLFKYSYFFEGISMVSPQHFLRASLYKSLKKSTSYLTMSVYILFTCLWSLLIQLVIDYLSNTKIL